MDSAPNVLDGSTGRKRRSQPSLRVLGDDALGEFARIATRGRARRIHIVSPWVSPPGLLQPLESMAQHLDQVGGQLIIITRLAGEALVQQVAVEDLLARGARVHELPELHAKIYFAELAGGRIAALVGSANMTTSSQRMREAGLLVVAKRSSRVGRDLECQVHAFKSSARRLTKRDIVLARAVRASRIPKLPI